MEYIPLSLLAGVLTVLAPCMLPVLPVILGGSLRDTRNYWRPIIITISLALSVIVFTLLLKASTVLLSVDPRVWNVVSGLIITFLGLTFVYPRLWQWFEAKLGLDRASGLLQTAGERQGFGGDILIGAALGPVFTSCSPTYALIVAVILPQDFGVGLINLFAYALGLALVLGLIAVLGQRFLGKVRWIANPGGWFKKVLGILLILLGLAIMTGFEKKIEAALLDLGVAGDTINLEMKMIEDLNR